ncbi:gliding motility lipoprotein GldB [Flavobacterium okayamense]|uniref:Gliding motility lipoprotein GldB n=1 Tax=Flavobacterium okayamense TaxID=2830782 RepID=A0ABM7S0V3_9FLAO|nr:gliding motility lipoprotein GldB [Flavobacterium okayamense]BCY27379.1 gliding motility lipoprotein GldB [Flavobacterium okayamense]
MKKLLFFSFILILASCGEDKKKVEVVNTNPINVELVRFDKLFYESQPEDLLKLKNQFPYFFPAGNEDTVWTNKLSNPLLRELYTEVQNKYGDADFLRVDLGELFGKVEYYFPKSKTPKIITLINEVDKDAKAIYADSLALISLDCYLGEKHRFYKDFPDYQKVRFNQNQILPDLVSSFAFSRIPYPSDRTLLSQMVYYGKELYVKDLLLPEATNAAKIGYSETHEKWCEENEAQMWSYFVENNLLYESNQKNEFRFINDAPFSKFYLEIDNESPGRVGQWLGWQIVRSFMENNDVSLQDMLAMDAKTIFENSKYKPAK